MSFGKSSTSKIFLLHIILQFYQKYVPKVGKSLLFILKSLLICRSFFILPLELFPVLRTILQSANSSSICRYFFNLQILRRSADISLIFIYLFHLWTILQSTDSYSICRSSISSICRSSISSISRQSLDRQIILIRISLQCTKSSLIGRLFFNLQIKFLSSSLIGRYFIDLHIEYFFDL